MTGLFLYFLPGLEPATTNRKKVLDSPVALAFSDAIRSERNFQEFVSSNFVQVGPNGSSGMLLACTPTNWPNSHRIGFYPDEQTWVEIGKANGGRQPSGDDQQVADATRSPGNYWLGFVTDCPPGPDSLQRETLISGYEVELGDGNVWFAPTIRRWDEDHHRNNLPLAIKWNAAGECIGETIPALRWAWELAAELWNFRMGIGSMSLADFNEKALRCLSVNYRLGIHEASALSLLTTENADLIVDAALDQQLINEFVAAQAAKKNQTAAVP